MHNTYNTKNSVLLISTLILFLSINIQSFCQAPWSQSDAKKLKEAGELWDERGYGKGNYIDAEGDINISAANGNVMYTYPISSRTIHSKQISTTLNYCGSVTHTAIGPFVNPDGSNPGYHKTFTQEHPAWIFGVNGFAVQMISATQQIYVFPFLLTCSANNSSSYCMQLRNDDNVLNMAVEGYDYSNPMNISHRSTAYEDYDYIKLLKSDGSILELRNPNTVRSGIFEDSAALDKLQTGIYYENGVNTKGYAIVSYEFEGTAIPPYVKTILERESVDYLHGDGTTCQLGPRRFKSRIVRYFPGDGLEYVFKEWIAPFGLNNYFNQTIKNLSLITDLIGTHVTGHIRAMPRTFYLREIKSGERTLVNFEYSRQFDPLYEGESRGRGLLKGFEEHNFHYYPNQIIVEALGRTHKIRFDSVITEQVQSGGRGIDWNRFLYPGGTALTLAEPTEPSIYKSWTGYVTKIVDPEFREVEFNYESFSRHMIDYTFAAPHTVSDRKYNFRHLRLSRLNQWDKQFSIMYGSPTDTTVDADDTHNIFNFDGLNVKYNNVAIQLVKYDKGVDPTPLSISRYFFNGNKSLPSYPMGGTLTNSSLSSWSYTEDYIQKTVTVTESANTIRFLSGVMGHNPSSVSVLHNEGGLRHQTPKHVRTWKFNLPPNGVSILGSDNIYRSSYLENSGWNGDASVPKEYDDVIVTEQAAQTSNNTPLRLLILPYTIKKYKGVLSSTTSPSLTHYLTSVEKHNYTLEPVREYHGNTYLKDTIGWGIRADTMTTYYPTDTTAKLLTTVTTYKNLKNTPSNEQIISKTWDKIATLINFLQKREEGDPRYTGRRWEDAMCDDEINVYRYDTISTTDELVPIYGITEKQEIYDGTGKILSGKANRINTVPYQIVDENIPEYSVFTLDGIYKNSSRGMVIQDTIIGRDGIRYPLNSYVYSYGGAWNGAGLLEKKLNLFGAEHSTRYDFLSSKFLRRDPSVTSCVEYDYAKYYTISNLNRVDSNVMQNYEISLRAEKPLMDEILVRKYSPAGTLQTTSIATLYEYGHYGLATKSIDPNGWLSTYDYDKIGRLKIAILPFDFNDPLNPNQQEIIPRYEGTLRLADFGYTDYKYRDQVMQCTYEPPNDTMPEGFSYRSVCMGDWHTIERYNEKQIFCAKIPNHTYYWDCGCGEDSILTVGNDCSSGGNNGISSRKPHNSLNTKSKEEQTLATSSNCTYTEARPQHEEYYAFVDIALSDLQTYKGVSPIVDSARLSLFITSITGSNVVLKVQIPQLNILQTITFTAPNNESNAAVDDPYLTINLNNHLSTLLSMANSETTLRVKLWTTTTGARIDFANNAEDTRPAVEAWGTFPRRYSMKDFTVYNQYNGFYTNGINKVQQYSKTDDILHTSDNINLFNQFLRYSSEKHYFAVDGNRTRSVLPIYNSLGTIIDTSVTQMAYTGFNLVRVVTDPLGFTSQTQYDAEGQPTQQTMPQVPTVGSNANDTTIFTNRFIINPTTLPFLSDQNFYGMCEITETEDVLGRKNQTFTDVFGRLRREIADLQGLRLTTKYEYDVLGKLKKVISPKNDTARYWYDNFGRVKYKHHPDMGFQSFNYDILGQLRFTQTAAQKSQSKMNFMQYDDAGRLTIIGEAHLQRIEPQDASPSNENDSLTLQRLTDIINPNILHDNGNSAIVTANKTLWMGQANNAHRIPMLQDTTQCFPHRVDNVEGPDLLNGIAAVFPSLKRIPTAIPQTIIPLIPFDTAGFEDVSVHDNFVRTVIQYDELPQRSGKIWGLCPQQSLWNALAPKGKLRNLVGKQAAIAYRDAAHDAFHFMMFSYDERGRIEAQIRYTENIGWDAIYYSYNSANAITKITVADPWRTSATWYGYDPAGRLTTLWTRLKEKGIGFNATAPNFPDTINKPSAPEALYSYDKRNAITQINYPAINTVTDYAYNARGWIDSMHTHKPTSLTPHVFSEALSWRGDGQIMMKKSRTFENFLAEQSYTYDAVNRLTQWQTPGNPPTSYTYDNGGNRIQQMGATPILYSYFPQTNRLQRYFNPLRQAHYTYNNDGAVVTRTKVTPVNSGNNFFVQKREEFAYNYAGLTRNYSYENRYSDQINDTCFANNPSWGKAQWQYRYGGGGEREHKRLLSHPTLAAAGAYLPEELRNDWHYALPWTYYLLDGGQRQHAVYEGRQIANLTPFNCGNTNEVFWVASEYLIHGAGDVPFLSLLPNGDKRYRIQDNLGSTRVVLTADGSPYDWNEYEPFGTILRSGGGQLSSDRLSYIGKEKDSESDLGDFGVRKYEAETGRFLSTDPLWEEQRPWNVYHYSANNPIVLKDPNGKNPLSGIGVLRGAYRLLIDIQRSVEQFGGMLQSGAIRPAIIQALGTTMTTGQVEVGAVGEVPDLDGLSDKEAKQALEDAGFQEKSKEGAKYKEYVHEDKSTVWIKPEGEVVRVTKPRYDPITGQRTNNGEKLIKTEEGEMRATRDQELIHNSRKNEVIKREEPPPSDKK
jgi:RHS repeat-associated protein